MAVVRADRVRDVSTTTGTGALTVSGTAPTGYRSFAAVAAVGDTLRVLVHNQAVPAEWEVGHYTYSAADTLTRTTVEASSNAGAAVVFSAGTKDVVHVFSATEFGSVGTRAITASIDGGGSAITTGIKGDILVPYACIITQVTMLADQSGSVVVDIWKDTYTNFPPTVADTITAAVKPTISAATKSQTSTLTGWTTTVAAGDILRFNVDSAATITRLQLVLTVTAV